MGAGGRIPLVPQGESRPLGQYCLGGRPQLAIPRLCRGSLCVWGVGAVHRVWCNTVEKDGLDLEGMFLGPGGEVMRLCERCAPCGLEGAGEKLGGEQEEVVADWEDMGFRVKIGEGA